MSECMHANTLFAKYYSSSGFIFYERTVHSFGDWLSSQQHAHARKTSTFTGHDAGYKTRALPPAVNAAASYIAIYSQSLLFNIGQEHLYKLIPPT